jgi:hypothetical protein
MQYYLKVMNSPPLSLWRVLIFFLILFSISSLKWIKVLRASDFTVKENFQIYFEKASMKLMQYLYPFIEVMGLDPYRSVNMRFIGSEIIVLLEIYGN